MRPRVIWAIARRDMAEVLVARAVWLPAIIVSLAWIVGLPMVVAGVIAHPVAAGDLFPQPMVEAILATLPPEVAASWRPLPSGPASILLVAGHFIAPLALLSPLHLVAVVGAAAFVGERERRTLEAVLYAPTSDGELLAGKLLAAVTPGLAQLWLNFLGYGIALTLAAWPVTPFFWFPTPAWWAWMLGLGPAFLVGMGLLVVVLSARSRTQLGAQQAAEWLVPIVFAFFVAQFQGLLVGDMGAWTAILWGLDAALLALAVHTFRRDRLIMRL